mgnify:CR=1 FL=1
MKFSYFIILFLALPCAATEQLAKRCQSCHGLDGVATASATPNLKGQHIAYLQQQLLDYKTRKRRHALMSAIASSLTEQQIEQLAKYYGEEHNSASPQARQSLDK